MNLPTQYQDNETLEIQATMTQALFVILGKKKSSHRFERYSIRRKCSNSPEIRAFHYKLLFGDFFCAYVYVTLNKASWLFFSKWLLKKKKKKKKKKKEEEKKKKDP